MKRQLERGLLAAILAASLGAMPGAAQDEAAAKAEEQTAPAKPQAPALAGWQDGPAGYVEAMRAHQDDGQPVIVYFYTDWCGYCRRLNAVLARKDVGAALDAFEKVRVNPEAGAVERTLAERFQVAGYPSFFVIPAGTMQPQKMPTFGEWSAAEVAEFVSACRKAAGL